MYDEHFEEKGSGKYKTRYWSCICWLDNMREDWREALPDLLQIPGFYGLHDKDLDKAGKLRKPHLHLVGCWEGPTTRKNAKEWANYLSKPGAVCCSTASPVMRMRGAYDYAIHDTDAARKEGKYQYDEESRVSFNGFEVGFYEQISAEEKDRMAYDITQVIRSRGLQNLAELGDVIIGEYDFRYFQVFKSQNAFFDRLCRGEYLKRTQGKVIVSLDDVDPGALAMSAVTARAEDGTRIAVCSECGQVKHDWEMHSWADDAENVGICNECFYRLENGEY